MEACNHASHQFWPEEISLLKAGLIRSERLLAPVRSPTAICSPSLWPMVDDS